MPRRAFGRSLEVTPYAKLVEDRRRRALDPMIENARLLGADATGAMRFDSSETERALTEVVAFETAVRLTARTGAR